MSGLHVKMAGQTINDRLLAARHSIAGQGLAKSVCKATTEEMIAPKKKHLDCKYCLCYYFDRNWLYSTQAGTRFPFNNLVSF